MAITFDKWSALKHLIRLSYPGISLPSSKNVDFDALTTTIFPHVTYADNERATIAEWLIKSSLMTCALDDNTTTPKYLDLLNIHLYDRTTILGSKLSIADIVVYALLVPVVVKWLSDESTGKLMYPNILRHVSFIQNGPLFGVTPTLNTKLQISLDDIRCFHNTAKSTAEEQQKRIREIGGSKSGAKQGPAVMENTQVSYVPQTTATDQSRNVTIKKHDRHPKHAHCAAQLSPSQIDFRVGHIINVVNHPNADSLYISTVTCGDPLGTDHTFEYNGQVVRTVCSGLNGLLPLAEMQDRMVVVICNLKPVTMRGVKSAAMVLAASSRERKNQDGNQAGLVELVKPPESAKAGERVYVEGWQGEPERVLNPKKKIWESIQPGLFTTEALEVTFDANKIEQLKGHILENSKLAKMVTGNGGRCTVKSLKEAIVS